MPGRVFQQRFATKNTADTQKTSIRTFMIFAVGMVYGKTPSTTKFHAAVVSRKLDQDSEWGPEETSKPSYGPLLLWEQVNELKNEAAIDGADKSRKENIRNSQFGGIGTGWIFSKLT